MKKAKLFAILFLLLFAINNSSATGIAPQFDISIRNVHTNPVIRPDGQDQDSLLDFDIRMVWTNSGVSDTFNYAAGQLTLYWNPGILNGGTATLIKLGSDLPDTLQNSYFSTSPVNGIPLLRAATNNPNNLNYIISSAFPGTLILRLRLITTSRILAIQTPDFHFKVGASPSTLYAYFDIPGGNNMVLLADTTLYTRTYESNDPLPVELSNFTSVINRNNVTLNWSTSKETNNNGFDIERKPVSSTEWTKAGYAKGNGTTNETKSYSFTERLNTGKYKYRLKQIDFNGNAKYLNLSNEVEVGVPSAYNLSQNYPNPFNPSTKIDFEIPVDGKVSIVLYDISGREVAKILNKVKAAGYYTLNFNASNLSSGMYFYRIIADKFVETKKMAVVK